MNDSKTDVWRELVCLLSSSPAEHRETIAHLLLHLLDDEAIDNHNLIQAIRKTRTELEVTFEKVRTSWA